MIWWVVGAALFAVAALGLYSAVRSPSFVAGLVMVMASAGWRALLPTLTRRMPPEKEAAWRKEQQAGRGDEATRKRLGSLKE